MIPLQCVAAALWGWIERERNDVIAFLREENRVLKAQLRGRHLRLSGPERRRLAALGHRLGRRALADVATIVSPNTLLRWHRELVVRQSTYVGRRVGRPRVYAQIRSLTVRMATENATWGYTRIQGALKNLGHHVGRSTIARILKEHGVPPSGQRPMAWRTFVRAHWPALIDFFRADVASTQGLVTSCAAFIIGPRSHLVYSTGSTARTSEQRLFHGMRQFTSDVDGVRGQDRDLICDAEPRRCGTVARVPASTKVPVIPANGQASAERFVCWKHEESVHRIEPLGSASSTGTHGLGRAQSQRTESSRASERAHRAPARRRSGRHIHDRQ